MSVIVLVGNKVDLDKIEVPHEELQQYANSLGALLKYTSAKDGKGVEDLFNSVAEKMVTKHHENKSVAKSKLKKSKHTKEKKPCC